MCLNCYLYYQKWKRLFLYIMMILCIISTSGCMNRREVDKLGLLGALAVDLKEGQVVVTMEVIRPKSQVGGATIETEPIIIVQSRGDSFFDAMRNVTTKFDRKIFLATNRIVIIGEEAAKEGVADFLDFWGRDHEARKTNYLIIAKNAEAAELIGITGGISETPSQYLNDLIQANSASSKSIGKQISDFIKEYYSLGIQPTVGVMQANMKEKSEGKNDREIVFEGSAVFKKDILVGYLDGIETRALNMIKGKIGSGIIVSPGSNTGLENSLEIINVKSKPDVILQGNNYTVKVELTVEGMLGEYPSAIDLRDPKIMREVEESFSKVVHKQVTEVITKAQEEYGVDIFGFGDIVHRKYPEIWKKSKDDWDRKFRKAQVVVEVKTHISRSGLFKLPLQSRMGN